MQVRHGRIWIGNKYTEGFHVIIQQSTGKFKWKLQYIPAKCLLEWLKLKICIIVNIAEAMMQLHPPMLLEDTENWNDFERLLGNFLSSTPLPTNSTIPFLEEIKILYNKIYSTITTAASFLVFLNQKHQLHVKRIIDKTWYITARNHHLAIKRNKQ